MQVSRVRWHYRSHAWMRQCFGKKMPPETNLCQYFWPTLFSLTIFPILFVLWIILRRPLLFIFHRITIDESHVHPEKDRRTAKPVPAKAIPLKPTEPRKDSLVRTSLANLSRSLGMFIKYLFVHTKDIRPLPEQEAQYIRKLQEDFVSYIFDLNLVCLCLGFLVYTTTMLVINAKNLHIPTYVISLIWLAYLAVYCIICVLSIRFQLKALNLSTFTTASFCYRQKSVIAKFNNIMSEIAVLLRLIWDFLLAKKEKICPLIVFVD